MAKDPAFLFYPGDYIGGTMGMTFEEKGAYIELLMMQFMRGHMTKHMIEHVIGHIWQHIEHKFIQDENGLYYNVRLDEEKIKRKKFTESRTKNKKGTNQYTKNKEEKEHITNHMSGHMTKHMENENVNENINSNENKKNDEILKNSNLNREPNKPTYQTVYEYFYKLGASEDMAINFFNKHEGTGWYINGSPIKNFTTLASNFINTWNKNKQENGTKSKSRSERQSESLHYLLRKGNEEYAKLMEADKQNKDI